MITVDLYAGAGGFSLGAEQAGCDVRVAVERDSEHMETHARNFPRCVSICADASRLDGRAILVHGGAKGADTHAHEWALKRGVTVHVYPAKWDEHGRGAGPRRNIAMLQIENPDLVLVFPGGRGTAHMEKNARARMFDVRKKIG